MREDTNEGGFAGKLHAATTNNSGSHVMRFKQTLAMVLAINMTLFSWFKLVTTTKLLLIHDSHTQCRVDSCGAKFKCEVLMLM